MTKEMWQLARMHELKDFGERLSHYENDEMLIDEVDEGFCNMMGYTQSELMIRSCGKVGDLIYPPDYEEIRYQIRKNLKQSGSYTCRYRMRKKDGSLIWVWENGRYEKDDTGRKNIRSLVVDVSREEKTMRERDTTYDNIPGGVMTVLVTDTNFYIMEANHQYFTMVGTTREQYLGSSGIYTYPQDLPGLRSHIIEQARKQEPLDYDFRTRHPRYQDTRWYRMVGRYYQESEEGCEYLCTLLDVTEQKRTMYRLEREKERYMIASGINAHFLFEYDVKEKQMQFYEDSEHMTFSLCVEKQCKGTLNEIMYDSGLLYPEDKGVFDFLYTDEISASSQIRFLTKENSTGKESYQWYEFAVTKVLEKGQVVRLVGSMKNIEEQKKQEEERLELQNIYQKQADKIYEIVIKVSLRDHTMKGYFTGEEAFEDIYPFAMFEDFVEKTATHYVHPEDKARFYTVFDLDNMKDVLESSSIEEVLFFRINKPGGDYRYKCFRYSYLGSDTDTIIVEAQDMHELRLIQLKEEESNRRLMAAALKEAKDMVEMRRNFLAILSREIKAPVQYVSTELHKQDIGEKKMGEIRTASQYVLEVIDSMAEYEKIEQGKLVEENNAFSLISLVREVVTVWTERMNQAKLTLEASFDVDWEYYYGDEKRIVQIFDHILGNCLLNSEEQNQVRVWGTVEKRGDDQFQLSVMFEDWGLPVDDSSFGRNYLSDSVNTRMDWRRKEGIYCTTFSLVLARRLAEFLGGRIELSRRGGNVNVMKLELPLKKGWTDTVKQLEPKTELFSNEVSLKGYKILVIEPQNKESDMVGVRLRVCGAQVDVAYSGKEGLELWDSYVAEPFDVVLVDAYSIDMDYEDFAIEFRSRQRAKKVPLFVMVDEIRRVSIETSIQTRINAYLEKPLQIKRFLQLVEAFYR